MAPVKIVCMIGAPPYLNYFVNRISDEHHVALVIRETTHDKKNLLRKLKEKGLIGFAKLVLTRMRNRKKLKADYDNILGEKWREPGNAVTIFETGDINSSDVIQKLEDIKPDLVLVHGTSLIKRKTIAGIPLVLNLHWGLSPYYKGSYCTAWALLNHDSYNIGYTIHRITPKIDGGDILTQGRVSITSTDSTNRINMRLTQQGTEAMINIISRLEKGEAPQFSEQDDSRARLYLVKQWTKEKQKELETLETPASIQQMLANPSAEKQPIVEW